jgi:hypothetical protein
VLSCADPRRLQSICEQLSAEKIDALLRKWLRRLPHPFLAADRKAGYRYAISILQAEFSLTQVLDRPVHGRMFFEEVIRENLDLGRNAGVFDLQHEPRRWASGGDSFAQRPEAECDFRLPPKAGFLHIRLVNRGTGAVISAVEVEPRSQEHPDRVLFSISCSSDRAILIPPDKDLLLHITSSGFHEWDESAGVGKPIRMTSEALGTWMCGFALSSDIASSTIRACFGGSGLLPRLRTRPMA